MYKGKGDPLDCGSYRAMKLLEHGMKVLERVLEKRIMKKVKIAVQIYARKRNDRCNFLL